MPLVNIFNAKELDDWSGKKTVKTGQIRSNLTAASGSVGSENALPSKNPDLSAVSDATSFSKQRVSSSLSKESAVSATGSSTKTNSSSTDPSSDDHSTIVLTEGHFFDQEQIQLQMHIQNAASESDDSDDDPDKDSYSLLDEYSLEGGYGGVGCMDCADISIELNTELVNSEAMDYWRRVKVNRNKRREKNDPSEDDEDQRRQCKRNSLSAGGSTQKKRVSDNDHTQIEVVHQESRPKSQSGDADVTEMPGKKMPFLRIIKKVSTKTFKALKGDHHQHAVTEDVNDENYFEATFGEATVCDADSSRGCEVELKPQQRPQIKKLVKIASKSNLMLRLQNKRVSTSGNTDIGQDFSCASSTEDPFGQCDDKYQTPADLVGPDGDGGENGSKTSTASQQSQEDPDLFLPEPSSNSDMSSVENRRHTKKSVVDFAKRSRASLMRIAQGMKYDSSAFSDSNGDSKGSDTRGDGGCNSNTVNDAEKKGHSNRPSLLQAALSKSGRLRQVGKGVKKGVARLRKLSSNNSLKETNLVVCIDGKGDRLSPSETEHTEASHHTDRDCDSQDDYSSVCTASDGEEVIVEVDGPVVFEMCLMGRSGAHDDFENEENSLCSTNQSEGRTINTDNTGWFLAHDEVNDNTGEEAPGLADRIFDMETYSPAANENIVGGDTSVTEIQQLKFSEGTTDGSVVESAASETETVSSNGDLNSLYSVSSKDESTLYELFPSNSFSSLTGIKCHSCTKGDFRGNVQESNPPKLRTTEVLLRGRSRVRSERGSKQRRSTKEALRTNKSTISSNDMDFGFNNKMRSCEQDQNDFEEDSIIECRAPDQEKNLTAKLRDALFH